MVPAFKFLWWVDIVRQNLEKSTYDQNFRSAPSCRITLIQLYWRNILVVILSTLWRITNNANLTKMTNKMQLCRTIYYSIFPSLLNMFQPISSLIIRSFWAVITASGFTHVCRLRPLSWLSYTDGHAVAQLVEALRYKPEGRGFHSRWCHWNFSLT
jgi:hypothetical protein